MATNIMIDLETTGTSAGCGILSIGAVSLETSAHFYRKISEYSCYDFGLTQSPMTMQWWDKQLPEIREEAFSGTEDLDTVLIHFSEWLTAQGEVLIWGNGADFDIPILKAAYEAIGLVEPWRPYNGRCYRTLKSLYPQEKIKQREEHEKHNALTDAKYQAEHLSRILQRISVCSTSTFQNM